MDTVEEYTDLVTTHLEGLKSQFNSELHFETNKRLPEEVKLLQIEYDPLSFSDYFSVYLYALDSEGNSVGDLYCFLENEAAVVPSEIYEAEKYAKLKPVVTAARILESWLTQRWIEVGNHRYPTSLVHHEIYLMRNTITNYGTNIKTSLWFPNSH